LPTSSHGDARPSADCLQVPWPSTATRTAR
jgi:hypothetical protein